MPLLQKQSSTPPPPPPPPPPLTLTLTPPPDAAASPTTLPAAASDLSPAVSHAPPPVLPPASPAAPPPPPGAAVGASAAVLAATTVLVGVESGASVELCFRVVGRRVGLADAPVDETHMADAGIAVEETHMADAGIAVEETHMADADAIADREVAQTAQVAQAAQGATAEEQQPSKVLKDEAQAMEDDAPPAEAMEEEAQVEAMEAMKEEAQVEEVDAQKKKEKKKSGDEDDADGPDKEDDEDCSVASTAVDDDDAGPRWRRVRRPCPPPTAAEPYVHRLAQLQSVAMLGSVEEQEAVARAELDDEAQSIASGSMLRLPWETPLDGGDARLRSLVPMLLADTATPASVVSSASVGGSSSCCPSVVSNTGSMSSFKAASWAMLATHLPGRSGRECRERWALLAPPHPPPPVPPPRRSPVQLDALEDMHGCTRHDEP